MRKIEKIKKECVAKNYPLRFYNLAWNTLLGLAKTSSHLFVTVFQILIG